MPTASTGSSDKFRNRDVEKTPSLASYLNTGYMGLIYIYIYIYVYIYIYAFNIFIIIYHGMTSLCVHRLMTSFMHYENHHTPTDFSATSMPEFISPAASGIWQHSRLSKAGCYFNASNIDPEEGLNDAYMWDVSKPTQTKGRGLCAELANY